MIGKGTEQDHKGRIERVFTYIDAHLDAPLDLEILAGVAHFSPFHFHRIFKFVTRETVNEYVTRRRLEKAALALLHKSDPIRAIGQELGFGSSSSFSRAFKKYFGESPANFRAQHPHRLGKIRERYSKNGQAYPDHDEYIRAIDNLKEWLGMNAKVEVRDIRSMEVAYISCIGVQHIQDSFDKLIHWAKPLGLMGEKDTKVMTLYFDSFKVTPPGKVRIAAAITVAQSMKTSGEVVRATIPGGRYIIGSYEIGLEAFEKAWTALFLWMNDNGYAMADGNPFEIYHNNFNEHPEGKARVDFYIPIR